MHDPMNLSGDPSIVVNFKWRPVCTALTKAGYALLVRKKVDVGGQTVPLSKLLPSTGQQVRCFKIYAQTWQLICSSGLRLLVTPKT